MIAQEQFTEASKALANAIRVDPDYADAHSDLGLALMVQGQSQEAENALIQAIRLQPDLAEAHFRLEQVRAAQHDSEQLIQSGQQILQILFRRE